MDLKMEVYSPGLELLGLLEIQNSVIWERKAFSTGSFSVEALITDESRTLLVPENIIWIAGEDAGIIEYIQEEAGENGPYIAVKGCDLTGILARRILWGRYDLSGLVPALMYQLVDDCCIHPTRGDTAARVIPNLRLSEVPEGGTSIRTQKTGGSLLEALELMGEAYQVPFGVRFVPEVPCMEFWARPRVNRSVHQTVNEPVFYSTELDDVLSSEYSYNAQDYRNVALVAGEGEGKDRVMVTVMGKVEAAPEPPTPPEPAVKYTVTLSVDPEGGGLASGGGEVEEGKRVTVTAAPAAGYSFSGWSEGGTIVSTSLSYTFTVTGDRALTAVFSAIVPTYTISASIDPEGSGTVTGAGSYQECATVTLTAAPGDGYKFTAWTENGETVSTDTEYTFTVTGDRTLAAVFAVKSRLPEGYEEVEYIQSSGTQYIDTNISQFQGLSIDCVMEFTENNSKSVSAFIASYKQSSSTFLFFGFDVSPDSQLRCMYGTGRHAFEVISANQKYHCRVNTDGKEFSVNGDKFLAPTTFRTSYNSMFIFATHNAYSNSATTFSKMRLYSFTVVNDSDGEFVRQYVPCINPSGSVGLYDLAGNKFYGNLGTGEFIAGPAV